VGTLWADGDVLGGITTVEDGDGLGECWLEGEGRRPGACAGVEQAEQNATINAKTGNALTVKAHHALGEARQLRCRVWSLNNSLWGTEALTNRWHHYFLSSAYQIGQQVAGSSFISSQHKTYP
jgi:hypothetical protein